MTPTIDTGAEERLGKPSASSMDRRAHCPGSGPAEDGLPELPADDDTAETGINVHGALETGDDEGLDMTEKEIAAKLKAMEIEETEKFAMDYGLVGTRVDHIREERFWIRNRSNLELTASARPDYCAKFEEHGIVLNFKTGFKHPTPSELSWQSRTEVIAFWFEHFDSSRRCVIRGGFLSSRLSSRCDTTDYSFDDLRRVENELRHIIWKSEQPNAERVPGDHCRYCRARGTCKEYAVYNMISAAQAPVVAGTKPDQLAIINAVGRMTPHEMAFVFKRKTSLDTIMKAIEARMKQLPKDQLAAVGYEVAPGNANHEIVDVATAFSRLGAILSPEERMLMVELTRGKGAELLAGRLGISKAKAQEQIDETIGDAMVDKPGKERLKPI